jgi:hypothetical protein
MSERFFDAQERDLYLAVAQAAYRDYPAMTAEAVDRIAWQAVLAYRARCQPDPIPDAGPTPADMRGEVDHERA